MPLLQPPCCPGSPRRGLRGIDPALIGPAQLAAWDGDLGPLHQLDIQNVNDRAARIAAMLADPSTAPSIRALAQNPLYGTFVGDALYNNPTLPTPPWFTDADRAAFVQMLGGVWAAAMAAPPP